MSNVWKGITENAQWVHKGSAVAIGNGQSTLFWDHVWATDDALRNHVIHDIPPELDGATVEEMWEIGQGWKFDVFANLLPASILMKIIAHKLVEDQNVGDVIYWKGAKAGGFSIKYALKLIREEDDDLNEDFWKLLWTTPLQQRVRVFLWLIMHDKVLSNANRLKRNLTDDPQCTRCNFHEETTLHLLRDCPHARTIWMEIGGPALYPSFFDGNLQTWLVKNLKAEGLIYSNKWPSCFAMAVWWIWRWRNEVTFDRNITRPVNVGNFIRGQAEEAWQSIVESILQGRTGSRNKQHEVLVRWVAPLDNWWVLNTDGASRGEANLAGGGGLIRDWRGVFRKGFTAKFGTCSAFKAELKALAIGLAMAKELDIPFLQVQVDSMACIQVLQNAQYMGGECMHIINECRSSYKLVDGLFV